MKKELLLTLMALTVSVFSWAQKVCSIEGVNYRSTSDKTASVSKSEKASGEVVIYNEVQIDGKNYEVTTIDDEAFRNCKEMVTITIPNSVTSIGKSAFLGCDGLKEVLLHKGGVDRWNKGIVKFADKYSNPVVITKTLSEIVKTEVKFTAPEIIKDDEPEGERKALVRFNTTWFEIDSHMDIPESQEAQQYLAELLFDEKGVDMKEAYDRFLKLWNHEERNITKTFGKISFDINKEYEQEGRFACYHVKASLKGNAMLTGLPQTKSAEKQKAQYFKLVKGIDNRFIVDTKEQKIAGVDQIFVPGIAEKIKQTFGADVNLYAEDRCLQLLSKDGSISSLRVVRPIHPLLDKEAIRVLSKMPKWKPGMIKGQTVRVKYTTPLSFRLQ